MSQENVEVVRQMLEAFQDAALEFIADDAAWYPHYSSPLPLHRAT